MKVGGLPRPLDRVRSIKVKISILLLASGGMGLLYLWLQYRWQPAVPITLVTIAIVLLTAQVLGHGMTSPVREMITAARGMAQGDYSRRVRATSRDEIGQLAGAFNSMAAELAAADQQRRELIANVSHELRTPIAALQAVLENVVDGVAEPDPATLSTALAQTERLGSLVSELLDLSRLDAGVITLEPDEFRLADMLGEAVAEAQVAARGTRDFHVDVAPVQTRVVADRARLHQVVVNLLHNAARHGPPGSAVHVHARHTGEHLVIEVSDEGPGIDPAERDRVFHRFTRGERSAGGGTGLGLAIARWAVDLHGGDIAVVDNSGPGARIRVSVPVPATSERPGGPAAPIPRETR